MTVTWIPSNAHFQRPKDSITKPELNISCLINVSRMPLYNMFWKFDNKIFILGEKAVRKKMFPIILVIMKIFNLNTGFSDETETADVDIPQWISLMVVRWDYGDKCMFLIKN